LWYAVNAISQVELPLESAQAVEGFIEIRYELIMVSGLDDHIIHVGFNVAM
jgi:hypothetical protein